MQQDNYWTRIRRERVSRRQMLRGAAVGGVGLAGLALVGCGDDDDDDDDAPVNGGDDTDDDLPADDDEDDDAPADDDETVADTPQRGGTYRWGWAGTPHMDIHQDSISGARQIGGAVYERLMEYQDAAQLPQPRLAAAMPEQPDETTLLFSIREGVTFHDKAPANGRPMVAADVAFSLNRARTDDPQFLHRGDLANVQDIEATDDATVRLTTNTPDAVILTTLAGYQFFVFAPEVLDQFDNLRTGEATIGTGAFQLDELGTDSSAKMSRHAGYWQEGMPYLDGAEQLGLGDPWPQFLAGNLDSADIPADQLAGFDSHADYLADQGIEGTTFKWISEGSSQGHFMNTTSEVFGELRVRQALNLLYDRAPQVLYARPIGGYKNIALGDGHGPFNLPQSEILETPGFREGAEAEADVAEALAMLSSLGYDADNPLTFEIMGWAVPNRSIGIDQLQLASETYRAVSNDVIQPTVKGLEWGVWKQAEANHEFEMISSAYSMGVDAFEALFKMYHSTGSRNHSAYKNAEFDTMLEATRGTFDNDERIAATQDLLRFVNSPEQVSVVWTGTGPGKRAAAAHVRGINSEGVYDSSKLYRVWFA